MYSTVMTNYNC